MRVVVQWVHPGQCRDVIVLVVHEWFHEQFMEHWYLFWCSASPMRHGKWLFGH